MSASVESSSSISSYSSLNNNTEEENTNNNKKNTKTSKSPSFKSLNIVKPHKYRKNLPGSMIDRNKFSIWSVLKQCVDKELYRFTIPIVWNEPISFLQRFAENARYSKHVLDKAAQCTSNPIDRMKYIAAFFVSSSSIHNTRLSKPFNPLLGETYELTNIENTFRVCCEQVSHHPPVSAYYAESIQPSSKKKWKYYGSVCPQIKLNLLHGCVEAFPIGIQTVELPELDEVYTWHGLKVSAHNLVLGKMWFEATGHIEILNHKLNIKCSIEFKPYSWFSGRQTNRCEGHITDANQNKVALLYGKWDECFYATNDVKRGASKFAKSCEKLIQSSGEKKLPQNEGIELIWRTEDTPNSLHEKYFNFSDFTMQLNEIYDDLKHESYVKLNDDSNQMVQIGPVAPTDCRYRPDMRLYEQGEVDIASNEKHRLEEKQREKRVKFESDEMKDGNYVPLWFDKKKHHVVQSEELYVFNEKYWLRDFTQSPDIY
jgi:hypothetical protein